MKNLEELKMKAIKRLQSDNPYGKFWAIFTIIKYNFDDPVIIDLLKSKLEDHDRERVWEVWHAATAALHRLGAIEYTGDNSYIWDWINMET